MEQRNLGLQHVPVIGIGCNNFGTRLDAAQSAAVVAAGIETGAVFFDTADVYGAGASEEFLGAALGTHRDRVFIATKFGIPFGDQTGGAHPDYVRFACEASLRRLGTDVIDLYQLHAPDHAVPLAETLGAMDELVTAGLVRQIGCSNFTAHELRDADHLAKGAHFVSVQNQYSLLWREPEVSLFAALEETGACLLPYYPLANGLLTGKYHRGAPIPEGTRLALMGEERAAHWLSEGLFETVETIRSISEETGYSMLTLAFSWLLSHEPVTCVIAGASSPEQVRTNAGAVQKLEPALLERLNELTL